MKWHPSGKYLTLAFIASDGSRLLILPIDDGELKSLAGLGNGKIIVKAWSPDGRRVAYVGETLLRDVARLDPRP